MSDLGFPTLRGFIDITRARIIRDWYRGGATLCGVTGHAFAAWPEDMARIAGHENNGNQILGEELCKVATEVLGEALVSSYGEWSKDCRPVRPSTP